MSSFMPSCWVIFTDSYMRVGMEAGDLAKSPYEVLGQIETFFRMTNPDYEGQPLTVEPIVPQEMAAQGEGLDTIRDFVARRGFFRVRTQHQQRPGGKAAATTTTTAAAAEDNGDPWKDPRISELEDEITRLREEVAEANAAAVASSSGSVGPLDGSSDTVRVTASTSYEIRWIGKVMLRCASGGDVELRFPDFRGLEGLHVNGREYTKAEITKDETRGGFFAKVEGVKSGETLNIEYVDFYR